MTRAPAPACGSGSGSSRRSPGACRRAVWMARLLGFLGCIVERRGQDREHHVRIGGLPQLDRLVRLDQDVRQAGQNLEMRVVACGDTNAHENTILTPVDALWELGEGERSPMDELSALIGPVRNGKALAHRGGHAALALEHGIRVADLHRPELLEDATRRPDRILLGTGGQTESYGLARQDVHACPTSRSPCRNAALRRPGRTPDRP